MSSFNQVVLLGHMTRDVEMVNLPSGSTLATFGIAVNEVWKDKSGEKKEYVTFLDCKAFGKTGEMIHQYLGKGDPILMTGHLRQERWEDKKEGVNRSKIVVMVDRFTFVGSKKDSGERPGPSRSTGVVKVKGETSEQELPFLDEEDLPF